jgi:hypothetical protein
MQTDYDEFEARLFRCIGLLNLWKLRRSAAQRSKAGVVARNSTRSERCSRQNAELIGMERVARTTPPSHRSVRAAFSGTAAEIGRRFMLKRNVPGVFDFGPHFVGASFCVALRSLCSDGVSRHKVGIKVRPPQSRAACAVFQGPNRESFRCYDR